MNEKAFYRWLYFGGAALFSAASILYVHWVPENIIYMLPGLLGPGLAFGLALFFIREKHPKAYVANFVLMTAVLFGMLGAMAGGLYAVADELGIFSGVILGIVGMLTALFTGTGYGHFLVHEHPPVKILMLTGALSSFLLFVLIKGFELLADIDLGIIGFILFVMGWQIILGFTFSRDNKEDLQKSKKHFLDLIRHIGKTDQ